MADIKDVKKVLAAGLEELSLAGTLDVAMDGQKTATLIGPMGGESVEIVVTVKRIDEDDA